MSLEVVEFFGKGFRQRQLPEHNNLKYLLLLDMKNQISQEHWKNIIFYLTWSNKIFLKAYEKQYFVDLSYYVRKGMIQGEIKYPQNFS